MILFYCLGGGLGHLARTYKIIKYLGVDSFKIICSPIQSQNWFDEEDLIQIPELWVREPHKIQALIERTIEEYAILQLVVDTFPFGIIGEIDYTKIKIPTAYVARYVKWEKYTKYLNQHCFGQVYQVEELHPEQQHFVNNNSTKLLHIQLPIPDYSPSKLDTVEKELWLIIHSYPKHEVEEIIAYAKDVASAENIIPYLFLVSQVKLDDPGIDRQEKDINSQKYFRQANRIFTAGGFNLVHELKHYREKHIILPFERKYDDQFLRKRRLSENRG